MDMWGPWYNEVLVFRRDVNKGDYAYGKGDTGNSCNTPTSEKRATGEGEGREEGEGVNGERIAIEGGVASSWDDERSWCQGGSLR